MNTMSLSIVTGEIKPEDVTKEGGQIFIINKIMLDVSNNNNYRLRIILDFGSQMNSDQIFNHPSYRS